MIHNADYSIYPITTNFIPNFYGNFKKYHYEGKYKYKYKNCVFDYNKPHRTLTIITNVQEILGTITPKESDYERYIQKVKEILSEVITLKNYKLTLVRVDYFVDLKFSTKEEQREVIGLLQRHKKKYYYMRQRNTYPTSVHMSNKKGSYSLNLYDKEQQLQDKFDIEDERYKNTLRIEVQVRKPKIIKLRKERKIPRVLKYYFSKTLMDELYFGFLENYLYKGDYVKLSKAKEIIDQSSYSPTIKLNLKRFMTKIHILGINNIEKCFSYNTTKKYITLLNELGVNPICLNENSKYGSITNLVEQLRDTANKNY